MMTDKDFDNRLRAIMDEGVLPYEQEQWEVLAQRLEDDRTSKNAVLRVLLHKGWASYTRSVVAIASGVVSFVLYAHFAQNEGRKPKLKQVNSYPTFFIDNAPPNVTAAVPKSARVDILNITSVKGEVRCKHDEIRPFQNGKSDSLVGQFIGSSTVFERESLSQVSNGPIRMGDSNRLNDGSLFLRDLEEKGELKGAVFFDLLGGYNVNSVKNGFNIGVNLRKGIYHRFRIEASVALVGGYNKTYKELGGIDPADSNAATGVERFEQTTNSIFYLQAAPSVSYELYEGFYLGWGLDAQRLINSASGVLIIDDKGAVVGSQPLWDFGTLLSTSYQLSPKMNAGIVYRKSIGSVTQGSTSSVSRDYMLMQMSFRIY